MDGSVTHRRIHYELAMLWNVREDNIWSALEDSKGLQRDKLSLWVM